MKIVKCPKHYTFKNMHGEFNCWEREMDKFTRDTCPYFQFYCLRLKKPGFIKQETLDLLKEKESKTIEGLIKRIEALEKEQRILNLLLIGRQ